MKATHLPLLRKRGDGIELYVRLTPKGGADRIEGVEPAADGKLHLKARVRAVPEKGAANAALEKLVADWLGLPKSCVTVAAGATSRLKTVHVAGDPTELSEGLVRRLGET